MTSVGIFMKVVLQFNLILSVVGLLSCGKTTGSAPSSADPNIPVFSTALTVTNKTAAAMTLSWAASDNSTATSSLTYKVLYSLSDNISTVADAEASGTILVDWTTNLLTTNLTSLSQVTPYYLTVLVRDAEGYTGISSTSETTLCSGKIMFITAVSSGSFGGSSGADIICNANKPTGFSGSTFKAMLTDASARRACYIGGNDNCTSISTGRTGWVFSAGQTICSSDYLTRVGTTNSNSLLVVTAANTLATVATSTYTGFNSAWGSSATNCTGWSSTSGSGIQGSGNGLANGSTVTFIAGTIPGCNTAGSIYCVEQ